MSLSPEAAETRLFADTLVCTEQMGYGLHEAQPAQAARAAQAAERLLRALGQFEPAAADEAEGNVTDPALARIEAKLDLLLEVLGRSGPGMQRPRELRWSRRGACIEVENALAPDTLALLSIEAQPGLPLPLELPVRVLALQPSEGGGARIWASFEHDLPALAASLERLLFRQHRRQIAAQRRA